MISSHTLYKSISTGILVLTLLPIFAQQRCDWYNPNKPDRLIKLNLLGIPFGAYGVEYEQSFREKVTWGIAASYTPNRHYPFRDRITEDMSSDNNIRTVKEGRFNILSITPQARFYFGDRDIFTRFYVSPYIRYARYTTDLTLYYDHTAEVQTDAGPQTFMVEIPIPISGTVNTLSAGVALGVQFNIHKSLYLDWKILGHHYGIMRGSGFGAAPKHELLPDGVAIPPDIQEEIRSSLQNLKDIPLYSFDSSVNDNAAAVKARGINIGFTSALSLGYRF